MRTELLELEKLPEISDEEKDRLKSVGVLEKDKSLSEPWPMPVRESEKVIFERDYEDESFPTDAKNFSFAKSGFLNSV